MTFRVNLFNDFCEHAKQWVRQNVDSGNLRIKNLNRSCAEVADWIDKHAVSAIFAAIVIHKVPLGHSLLC